MSLARKALLAAANNAWLRDRATRTQLVRRSVSRFMPGERLEDAMSAVARQRSAGISAILTQLGENLTDAAAADAVTQHYLDVLDTVGVSGLDAQISVKLTQLGFDLDQSLSFRNLQRLLDRARERHNFVWLDMESARYVDATLDLFRRAHEYSKNVGVAVQAYLYRTAADVEGLLQLGTAIRLVKGAYLEPSDVAYPRKSDVDENYYRLACRILDEHNRRPGTLLHIATHDSRLIDRLTAYVASTNVSSSAYEYAMLYGIQEPLQHRLVAAGERLRVLISYGEHWFPWYMRRLAERPANVLFLARSLFAK
jgi:proline dehydrogenase